MWKRLDEKISLSEKHGKLSWEAFGVWVYLLANSDARGRYSGDAKVIKARCMTYRETVRLEQVEDALQELCRERVLHFYHVGSRRYVQVHDHDSWNPPGALRYQDPKHPAPPPDLCTCTGGESGVNTPLVSSSSLSTSTEGVPRGREPESPPPRRRPPPVITAKDEVLRQLFELAKDQNILAKDDTLTSYLAGWMRRLGSADKLQEKLMDPIVVGKTVIEIQDWMFPKIAQKSLTPAAKTFKCAVCNDSGKVVTGYENREAVFGDCSCKRRREGA